MEYTFEYISNLINELDIFNIENFDINDKKYEDLINIILQYLDKRKYNGCINWFIKKTEYHNIIIAISYFYYINKHYEKQKEILLFGVKLQNHHSINNLAYYYRTIEKDYNKAKEYYLMAIEEDNEDAMNDLANHYKDIEQDYDQMKKYYLLAIEKDNKQAMNNLAKYYYEIEKNNEELYNLCLKYPNLIDLEIFKKYDTVLQYHILKSMQNKTVDIKQYLIELISKPEINKIYNNL